MWKLKFTVMHSPIFTTIFPRPFIVFLLLTILPFVVHFYDVWNFHLQQESERERKKEVFLTRKLFFRSESNLQWKPIKSLIIFYGTWKSSAYQKRRTRSVGCWWEFWIYTRSKSSSNIVVCMSGIAFNLSSSSLVLMRKSSRYAQIFDSPCRLHFNPPVAKWKFIVVTSNSISPKGSGMPYNGF